MEQSSQTPIAIVGNVNLDIKTGPMAADSRLFRDGETSVGEIYESIGGGGANTAVAAARMGGTVHFCAAIGDDELGNRLETFLRGCKVTPHLARKSAPTGRSIALNWEQHQRHFVSSLPSALLLNEIDIDIAALAAAGCGHLYRADLWFAPAMLEGGNLRMLQAAHDHQMQVSFDINWDPHWHAGRHDPVVEGRIESVARLLPLITFAHGNQRELCFFSDTQTMDDCARWFFAHGAQALIVHLGRDGSAAFLSDGHRIHVPVQAVPTIVTETGTGDVFTAAFLLREGMELGRRLAESNETAADHLSGRAAWLPRM